MKFFLFKIFQHKNEVQDEVPSQQKQTGEVECPSFDEEPWKSQAEKLRPKQLDYYAGDFDPNKKAPPPLDTGHPYVQLILRFLDSIPDECWIDEENDVD